MFALALSLVAAVASTHPLSAPPIVRRHDRPDSLYRNLARRFDAVGTIAQIGNATLIADRWAITAAHVAREMARTLRRPTVKFGAREYQITAVYLQPQSDESGTNDIALLRLATDVALVHPLKVYRDRSEAKQLAFLVGAGMSGLGNVRERDVDHELRAATNVIDSADASALYVSFDDPPNGTELEGAAGSGDSGGPAILVMGDVMYLVGVGSAGYDGVNGPASYGAIDIYTRVSSFASWIDDVMSEQFEPSWSRERGRLTRGAPPAAPHVLPVQSGAVVSTTGLGAAVRLRQSDPEESAQTVYGSQCLR